jgi:threonine dehydrogenase-like Zn-dependent dehydrogenase
VNKSAIIRGETALVIGCGPIGIAIIAALKGRGTETIVASDFSAKRREMAMTLGTHGTIDPADGSPFESTSPAVVFEAVGAPGVIDDVLRRAPRGTRLVVAGVCMQPDAFRPFLGIAKQISVQFVFGYDPAEFAPSLRSIADGEVGPQAVEEAFDDLSDPDRHCKILVLPNL